MKDFALDGRLLSVAELVRQGAEFADIGTDHAYLPLALLREGRIFRAVCSDINDGPLESARKNALEAGFYDNIRFYLTDGAAALSGEGITDMAICGMGGELIADIIDRAPYLKSSDIHLILQPMSKQAHLRAYLAREGYKILCESYSYSQGKYYVTLLSCYTGAPYELTEVECELGFLASRGAKTECERGFLLEKQRAFMRALDGKRRGNLPHGIEISVLEAIAKALDGEKAIFDSEI